jgi:hypothetical protein
MSANSSFVDTAGPGGGGGGGSGCAPACGDAATVNPTIIVDTAIAHRITLLVLMTGEASTPMWTAATGTGLTS